MADAKISQLPVATTPLAGTELVPIVQSATTKQTTVDAVIAAAAASSTVVSSSDIGTAPNEIPLNQYLGTLAYQDSNAVNITGGTLAGLDIQGLAADITSDGVNTGLVNASGFVAASSAVLRGGATNLLTYSEDFSNAAWDDNAPNIATATINAVAPNGTTSGNTLTAATGGAGSSVRQDLTLSGGVSYAFSVYVKQGTSTSSRILVRDNTNSTNFIQITGLSWDKGSPVLNGVTSGTWTSTNVGNGWHRLVGIGTAGAGATISISVQIFPDNAAGTQTLLAWGAQIEAASTAGPYLKTVANAVTSAYAAPIESPTGLALPLLSSMTPARNGDMMFQLTSNTSLEIKVRGSDGVVRSVALTLA